MTDVTAPVPPLVAPAGADRHPAQGPPGSQQRRGAGASPTRSRGRLVLFGVAGFALALAVALPAYVYPRLTALPADPQREQVLQATRATVLLPDLDSPAGARVQRADVTIRTFVSAADPPIGDSVVWRIATRTIVAGHGLLDARVETISLDRRTGASTNCCGDRLQTTQQDPDGEPLVHNGFLNFPLDVQKRDYPLWDIQLRRARTARYIGEETREGIHTYVFRVTTPLTTIGSMELPGLLFRQRTPSVTATSEYADVRTYWIEPNSSQIVDLEDHLTQQFRYDDRVVPAMVADLRQQPSAQALAEARQAARILPWLRGRASVVLVLLAVALLAAGLRPNRRRANET